MVFSWMEEYLCARKRRREREKTNKSSFFNLISKEKFAKLFCNFVVEKNDARGAIRKRECESKSGRWEESNE